MFVCDGTSNFTQDNFSVSFKPLVPISLSMDTSVTLELLLLINVASLNTITVVTKV